VTYHNVASPYSILEESRLLHKPADSLPLIYPLSFPAIPSA